MEIENKQEKVAAVVVTYNRKELLRECLDALLNQTCPLDSIIIIDNASTDGTEEFLKEKGYLNNQKIDYVKLPQNIGGAGGFYEGLKRAYEKGYDWFWLMDDDGLPKRDTLSLLIEKAKKESFKVISPLVLDKNNENMLCFPSREYKTKNDVYKKRTTILFFNGIGPFLGGLIHKEVVSEIGFPNKDFFIYGDEVDYLCRIKKKFKTPIYLKAHFLHPAKKLFFISFFVRGFYVFWASDDLRNYFQLRNNAIIFRLYPEYKNFPEFLKDLIKYLIFIVFFSKNKLKNLKIFLLANFYGLQKNLLFLNF